MRIRKLIFYVITIIGVLFPMFTFALGVGTIDPANRISWLCTNETGNTDCHDHTYVNWYLASSTAPQVNITDSNLTGWIFSSEIGWIHLAPTPGSNWGSGSYSVGVVNDNAGNLSDYAWAIAGSWVNFNPTAAASASFDNHGVEIDPTTGDFSGWAWIQNYGWMLFDCSKNDGTYSACVKETGWTPSHVSGTVAASTPTAVPLGSTYTSVQSVTLSSANSSTIYYTTDGTDPTCSSGNLYSDTISISTSTNIKAIGCASGGNSAVAEFDYVVNISPIASFPYATPDPTSGPFSSSVSVTLNSANSSAIYYTTDGTDPTCSSGNLYSDAISISTSTNIKAIGCASGGNSAVAEFDYVVNISQPASTPVASPSAGTYSTNINVTLSSDNSTSILYTNDNSDPSCSYGTVYSGAIPISNNETIKAIGCAAGGDSSVAIFPYTISTTIVSGTSTSGSIGTLVSINPPQASLSSGTYQNTQTTTLFSSNATTIRYTTDNSTPSCSSGNIYNGGINVGSSETIKAIGCDNLGNYSGIVSFNYSINPLNQQITETVSNITNQSVTAVVNSIKKTTDFAKTIFSSPQNTAKIQAVTTVGVVVGSSASLASGIIFSSFSLTDLILIPLRLWSLLMAALGFTKRKKPWGTVYDSVTKQPLDPAYVILRSIEGQDISTAITDLDGRYGFVVPEPGNYSIFVNKTNYLFPSQKLVGQDHDELYRDLYFGEHFYVTEKGEVIAKNIPMDPEKFDWNEFAKRSQHLMKFYSVREKWFSRVAGFFFIVGFVVSSVAVLFSMTKTNIIIFLLYVLLFFVRMFGLKSRPFGAVVSKETGKPIPFSIIRVSQASTGVEILHRVADQIGRYYCLLPNGEYLIRVDKKMPDGSYIQIADKIPVTVTKGYMSEKFDL